MLYEFKLLVVIVFAIFVYNNLLYIYENEGSMHGNVHGHGVHWSNMSTPSYALLV
jgi:hypothetical protein